MSQTIDNFNKHIMGTYKRLDIVMDSGKKEVATDENNKTYIDFGSGIGTNSLGYCNDEWVENVCNQVKTLQHTSNYFYTKVQSDFAARLCDMTGYSKVFFGNSGAEANECAIKLARKYSFDKYGSGRHTIITLTNSFHGRTLCTLSATGQDCFHNYFFPFVDGFKYVKANSIEDLVTKLDDTVCAVMFEFVQGEGGIVPLKKDFISAIFSFCEEKDILTIADEIQTGVGRSGKFLTSEIMGVKPDITTVAKGIAGGLPMGVCMANKKCADVLGAGTHGSTFGGNPVCCAGGMAVLDKINEKGFLEEVSKKSTYIKSKLNKMKNVSGVDGVGLMLGIRLKRKDITAHDVLERAAEKGLLVLTAKEKIRLLPPLTITYEEIDKGIDILREIIEK